MMKILVSGAIGFIGSLVAMRLLERGANVGFWPMVEDGARNFVGRYRRYF
jgi:UDP-glucose 4-epimerase